MQANEIAVGPGVSEGVRILRDYLEYAAIGKIETGVDTGRQPESPFEEYVLDRLRVHGLEVDPQVGVAGFRIDLGVRHPDYPHGYLLGVECDGRTYHSALSVRDRDRLREAVLRGLGWDIYRIWSTDWFEDADREMKQRRDLIHSESVIELGYCGQCGPDARKGLTRRQRYSLPKTEAQVSRTFGSCLDIWSRP